MTTSRVAVVYPFFAHYRKAMIDRLVNFGQHRYDFFSSTEDPMSHSLIESADFDNEKRFKQTRCFMIGPFLFQSKVIALALDRNYDAVIYHASPAYLSIWISAALARMSGKKVYFCGHGWTHNRDGFRDSVKTLFFKLSNKLLLYGHHARAIGLQRGFTKEKLVVIYNSIRDFKSIRNKLSETDENMIADRYFDGEQRPIIISIGRLIELKKNNLLVEAVNILKKRDLLTHLLFIGDGPDRKSLEILAAKYNLSVFFTGAIYDDSEISNLVSSSTVCVVPGRIGLTAIDSLGFGTPVVTHNDYFTHSPEFEAIEDKVTGTFYEAGCVESLADAVEYWVTNKVDRECIRKQCYRVVDEKYSPKVQQIIIDKTIAEDLTARN